MTKLNLHTFGKIDFGNIPESNLSGSYGVWDSKITLHNREIKLTLWVDRNEDFDAQSFDTLATILEQLKDYDEFATSFIADDINSEDGSEHVHLFFEFLKDECGIDKESVLNQIYLHKIVFYPNANDTYAVFDYSIDPEIVGGQVLAVNFGKDGKFLYIAWES